MSWSKLQAGRLGRLRRKLLMKLQLTVRKRYVPCVVSFRGVGLRFCERGRLLIRELKLVSDQAPFVPVIEEDW
jgi:hypothetical protein